jgi:hypothetical protein
MREVYCELTPTMADTPTEGPYIVREPEAPRAAASSDSLNPHPAEAARTRDGEIDPPEAASDVGR